MGEIDGFAPGVGSDDNLGSKCSSNNWQLIGHNGFVLNCTSISPLRRIILQSGWLWYLMQKSLIDIYGVLPPSL